MSRQKKQRGQRRKLRALRRRIDCFTPFSADGERYERYLVPGDPFIGHRRTGSKIKTAFCRRWIAATEYLLVRKPVDAPFCKIVGMVVFPDLWRSEIIAFYDEEYYRSFWKRSDAVQSWTKCKKSLIDCSRIKTDLRELCMEEMLHEWGARSQLFFYGDIPDEI